jgi:hypothetical protein
MAVGFDGERLSFDAEVQCRPRSVQNKLDSWYNRLVDDMCVPREVGTLSKRPRSVVVAPEAVEVVVIYQHKTGFLVAP